MAMHIYPSVGRCIYCGKTQADLPPGYTLDKEHIVPLGMRGDLVLPEASCKAPEGSKEWSCSAQTCLFEGKYLQEGNDGLRTYLGVFSTRRKKKRRTKIPLIVTRGDQDGKEYTTHSEASPEDHPFMAGFPVFDFPELLSGRKAPETVDYKAVVVAEDEKFTPHRGNWVQAPGQFTSRWIIPLLAKIAHSYAIAEYSVDSFAAFLPEVILAPDIQSMEWQRYIGCPEGQEGWIYASPHLHELLLETRKVGSSYFIVCRIRLFACVENSPAYDIVVGAHWNSSLPRRTASIQQR